MKKTFAILCCTLFVLSSCVSSPEVSDSTPDQRYPKLQGSLKNLAIAYEEGNSKDVKQLTSYQDKKYNDQSKFSVDITTDGEKDVVLSTLSETIEIAYSNGKYIMAYITAENLKELNDHPHIKRVGATPKMTLE